MDESRIQLVDNPRARPWWEVDRNS